VSSDIWSNIHGGFLDHLDEINQDLVAAGLPVLEKHVEFGAIDVTDEMAVVTSNGGPKEQ
jgi:hypothetical protein